MVSLLVEASKDLCNDFRSAFFLLSWTVANTAVDICCWHWILIPGPIPCKVSGRSNIYMRESCRDRHEFGQLRLYCPTQTLLALLAEILMFCKRNKELRKLLQLFILCLLSLRGSLFLPAAIYLCKRTMQNKARLELADYEAVSKMSFCCFVWFPISTASALFNGSYFLVSKNVNIKSSVSLNIRRSMQSWEEHYCCSDLLAFKHHQHFDI